MSNPVADHPALSRTLQTVADRLTAGTDLRVQSLIATHSPLVLASAEPSFTEELDGIFHFNLDGEVVEIEECPWTKQGDVVNWLTSDFFGLEQARSREAERAIEAAEAWMRNDQDALPEGLRTQDEIHQELLRVLAGHDAFWPRWIVEIEEETS